MCVCIYIYTQTVSTTIFQLYGGLKAIHLIIYMRYSKLEYKIGFALDSFAQL